MNAIPMELSLTEYAAMAGLTRKQVAYRARRGGIPTVRIDPKNPRSKRVVLLSALQAIAPDLWQSLVARCQLSAEAA